MEHGRRNKGRTAAQGSSDAAEGGEARLAGARSAMPAWRGTRGGARTSEDAAAVGGGARGREVEVQGTMEACGHGEEERKGCGEEKKKRKRRKRKEEGGGRG